MNNKIRYGNQLIADYLNFYKQEINGRIFYNTNKFILTENGYRNSITLGEMKFHSSYDWIIPVLIDVCKTIDARWYVDEDSCYLYSKDYETEGLPIITETNDDPIMAIFKSTPV